MRMTGSPNLLVKGERQIARSCVKRRSASAQSLSNRQQLRAQEGAGRAQGCAAVPRRRRQRTSPTFTVASASRCHRLAAPQNCEMACAPNRILQGRLFKQHTN